MGRIAKSCYGWAAVMVVLFLFAGLNTVIAGEQPAWDRFTLTVATFRPSIDTNVRLDSSALLAGTEFDLEEDLALDDSDNLLSIEAMWRITQRFSLEASYFELGRSGSTTLSQQLDFGDQTFNVNEDVTTTLNTDIASLVLQYSFWHNEKLDIAGSAGAYLMKVEARIDPTSSTTLSESADVDVPLPLLGLRFAYNFTPRLSLNMKARYFDVDLSDVEGSMINFLAGLRFDLFKHLGVGIGYEYFDVDATSENVDFPGLIQFKYEGPKVFMTAQF